MKKIILLSLCVCMLLTVLSGCRAEAESSGNIDPKLVGKWEYVHNYCWYFFGDGRFNFLTSDPISLINGRYTTSNGRVYLTDIVNVNFEDIKYKNQSLEYSFGTNAEGEYLLIPQYQQLHAEDSSVSSWLPHEFKKDNSFVP